MTRGKQTCKILKEIRQQIADRNDIEYITSECHFQGECKGTCPKCEAELQYLEKELSKRRQLGKAVAVAGISLGIAGSFAACNSLKINNISYSEQKTVTDTINIDTVVKEITGIIGVDDLIRTINEEPIFVIVEDYPEYPGGDEARIKFLQENIVYPRIAGEMNMEGRVVISFVVEKDGSLTNFKVLRSVHPRLDEMALRVAKLMPNWKPGKQRGVAVRTQYSMPITFMND